MSVSDLMLFAAYTVASVTSLVLIKAFMPAFKADLAQGHVVGLPAALVFSGALLYVVAFLVWMIILARHDLTLAYPTAIGLTLVFSTVTAAALLGEPLSLTRSIGMLAIFAGIVLVLRS